MKNKIVTVKLVALAMAFAVTAAQAQTNPVPRTSTNRISNFRMNVESDSAGDPNKHITLYRNGDVYRIKLVKEKITEMYIDDKKVPEEDFPKYSSLVKEILEQLKRDEEQAARDREQAERDREQADRDRLQAEKDRQQAERDRLQAEKDREQAEHDRQQADRDRIQAEKDRHQAERDRIQADKDREQAENDRRQADRDRQQAERDRQQADKDRAQAEIDRKQAEEDRKLLAAFIDDLIKEKVVGSKNELFVVQLSDESLIVNDKKQPAELHQKFKTRYLKTPGSRFTFTNGPGRRTMSIDRE